MDMDEKTFNDENINKILFYNDYSEDFNVKELRFCNCFSERCVPILQECVQLRLRGRNVNDFMLDSLQCLISSTKTSRTIVWLGEKAVVCCFDAFFLII